MFISWPNRHLENQKPQIKTFLLETENSNDSTAVSYWLISNNIQEKVDIIPAFRSDHSAITLYINGIENLTYGPSFWKFNASFVRRWRICILIRNKSGDWVDESREIKDPRVTWDYLKYKIRYETIGYSKKKAKQRRSELVNLESRPRR